METDKIESEETLALLDMLPEEVWHLVFDCIPNSSDLENVWNACTLFKSLLHSKRAIFLFPKVWSVMCHDYLMGYACTTYYLRQPERSDMLSMRLVCRSWCNTIDKFFQDPNRYLKLRLDPLEDIYRTESEMWFTSYFSHFDANRDAKRFIRLFQSTHRSVDNDRSPFIDRSVKFSYYFTIRVNDPEDAHYIEKFLRNYGHHIWHFTVHVYDAFPRPLALYIKLMKYLPHLPNLKYLYVQFHCIIALDNQMSPEEIQELNQIMTSVPIPTFKCLQFLTIKRCPRQIAERLLTANRHVTVLDIDFRETFFQFNIFNVALINLTQLSLKLYTESAFKELEETGTSANLSLQKLSVECDEKVKIKWTRIFSLLEAKWGDTLTNVVIHLPKWKKVNICSRDGIRTCSLFVLKLSNLRSLSQKMEQISTLDFILPMVSSLEMLKVDVRYGYEQVGKYSRLVPKKGKQKVEFIGYSDCMLESNIWLLFPNLKLVLISEFASFSGRWCSGRNYERKHFKYSRQEWEERGTEPGIAIQIPFIQPEQHI